MASDFTSDFTRSTDFTDDFTSQIDGFHRHYFTTSTDFTDDFTSQICYNTCLLNRMMMAAASSRVSAATCH
ncbi:hypothetical protein HanRHA438_Chr08g0371431 [Helianthus annuus]|uniref:Uncharacterized protein n=1 Tax=Helianthus annuus TaxID=4232 RepID=A0A9K3IHN4_HELAN|nr:hypothetical protein HanXRQr2_Chr08g0359351 [Helianthus annuus]KAJ0530838.1 hypothetical protein HanHA89_Chr10g0394461 [Helianthus annuus]KAJ0540308.1 hypothetical protein HanHA300_Chr08g0296781 [Helianthus annuus]KAJ0555051.1 hypothetical protein HanHA89_Chr08g0315281 [Helianthus annuus]KAJ0720618.1 hypothetical protein HanLR1_Chr08g0295631 [Helianthus annuus]